MNERISLMDRFQMNRSGCRPYQYTCGMNGGMAARNDCSSSDMANHGSQNGNHCNSMKKKYAERKPVDAKCREPETALTRRCIRILNIWFRQWLMCHARNLRLRFELKKALQVGTIFPELCKPFCGRRGGRR